MGQQQGQRIPAGRETTRPQLRPVTVEDIVQTDVVTAERDTPVATVVAEMAEKDVGSVVVVEDDRPVGVITDRSVVLSLESDPDVSERKAEEIMGESPVTGTTDMTVFKAIRRMREGPVRRLPIVDEDGTLQGIVTLDDILIVLGTEVENATQIIREQVSRA